MDEAGMVTARFLVRGRVQGVGFRWWTVRQARSLGVRGWVRNLDDGRVEVMATGGASVVDRLGDALGQGPSEARVLEVIRDDAPDAAAVGEAARVGFDIRQ